ncbi:MAG TPA: ferrochelatase [Gemmatimonadota bacterium]|nr:ferrochelatase [Gemmatimonadota bacterium]
MRRALLVMSYGTPERLEEVEPYYTHIRRGSPPPPELLAELVARYEAVGGPTALNRITREQAAGLGRALAERGREVPVYTGFKHVSPFIGDAVRRLAADGIERAVGIVLAPHYSLRSIAEYARYAEEARPPGLELEIIRSWHDAPGFVAFLAARLREAVGRSSGDPIVLFTAHSVPARVLEDGDPYPDQLRETCELVAREAGVDRWEFAFQSAGRTADPWLGPDVLDAIEAAADREERDLVIQSVGFVADHLEILYDLDIEARQAAEARGMGYVRAAMPNAHPEFLAALADVVTPRI